MIPAGRYMFTMNKAERDGADRAAFAEALDRKKMTQTALAERLGMTRQAITNWGGIVPEKCILRVSLALGVPPAKLRPGLVDEFMNG